MDRGRGRREERTGSSMKVRKVQIFNRSVIDRHFMSTEINEFIAKNKASLVNANMSHSGELMFATVIYEVEEAQTP